MGPNPPKSPWLVLVSGGIESSVLCAYLLKSKIELYGLFINRNQRALNEERVALDAVCQLNTIPRERMFELCVGLDIFRPVITTPIREKYGIPGRNLINVALAVPLAIGKDCGAIAIGCTTADTMPDCSPRFLEATSAAISECLEQKVPVIAPFQEEKWDKADVINWALEHGSGDVVAKTFSCVFPKHGKHCGVCFTCKLRRQAFVKAGKNDPTIYVYRDTEDGVRMRDDET